MGLDWPRFVVAVAEDGRLIGCGQIKVHEDGSRELASIAVAADWRGQGVAKALIDHLVASHVGHGAGQTPPLYLTCRAGLGAFYERFGFRAIPPNEAPPYFQRVARLVDTLHILRLSKEGILVMRREG